MKKHYKRFPTMAVFLLVFAVIWLLDELGYIIINIPWIPVILILIAVGMIFNRLRYSS